MSEVDYQMALLLQHKLDQESKSKPSSYKSDEDLARQLQEQFEHEQNVEKPSSLVYDRPKSNLNSSKSLTDPSWELVDPTPDIHLLFVAFNERFFWNKLLSVCVSWSKRMTSCAGICSYNGRGGMCHITLSEPLLKLRPRKDLVETLLHEMIHAYLFVTHNNRDRDGHGPEFHKHMYRINKETGTNITVYHSFHDEVRLYKQHWWRCNGPCQSRKPFFGMVKRASNRAPGPNDRWWGEHLRNCGGTFIKVKEPEKVPKKSVEKKQPVKKGADIRKFMSPVKKDVLSSKVVSTSTNTSLISSSSKANVTINDLYSGLPKNVKSFKDLSCTSDYKPTVFNNNSSSVKKIVPRGNTISDDFLATRNHWQNKFNNNNNNSNNSKKRPSDTESTALETNSKVPKIDQTNCPVCNQIVPTPEMNVHLDLCLSSNSSVESDCEVTKSCPICKDDVVESKFDRHVEQCILKMHADIEVNYGEYTEDKENIICKEVTTECLACGKTIDKGELSSHLEHCMNLTAIFDGDDGGDDTEPEKCDGDKLTCPICFKVFPELELKAHVDECLNSSSDIFEIFDD